MEPSPKLPGATLRRLQEALLSAFPTRSALAQMVRVGLEANLEAIAAQENLSVAAFELIGWAEAQGRLEELIAAARRENPGNPPLRAFAEEREQTLRGSSLPPARVRLTFQSQVPHNLPPRRLFIGREDELKQLDEALRRDERISITQASLWGLGGVGKTALVLEYAYRALEREAYPGGIWWVPAEGLPLDAILRLSASLRTHTAHIAGIRADLPADEIAQATRRALEAVLQPSLLVLDNVSGRGFANLLPGGQVRVLITTRDRRLALGKATALEILSPADARALAIGLAGGAPANDPEAAALSRVVEQSLGGLAVAIEVAARAVREWAGGWGAYEQMLTRQMDEALDAPEERSEHYPRGVFAALDLSIDRCGEYARRLLEGAAAFAPEHVPLPWACAAVELDPDGIVAQRAVGALEGLCLVKVDREAAEVSTHRLVYKRVRDRVEPEAWRGTETKAALRLAESIQTTVGPTREQMDAVDTRKLHIEEVLQAAKKRHDNLAWVKIANRLAFHLRLRASYSESRAWAEQALATAERLVPSDISVSPIAI